MNRLVIIGASGHGKVCVDVAQQIGYEDIFFLDDDKSISSCAGKPVIGRTGDFKNCLKTADFFVAIGNSLIRQRITEEIEIAGGRIIALIHPNAVIGGDVKIEKGSVVMAGVVINPGVKIGKAGIINTSSSIDHDSQLGDYVHISVGAHLAGTVNIGNRTWIGAGAIVSNNISVCEDCMIGAGAVVVKDIREAGTYIGIPAKRILKH